MKKVMTAKKEVLTVIIILTLVGLAITSSTTSCAAHEIIIDGYEPVAIEVVDDTTPIISETAAYTNQYEAPFDLNELYGSNEIKFGNVRLQMYDLPDKYYPGIDYHTMQPYMSYKMVTNTGSDSYRICHSKDAYTDNNGYRRYKINDQMFTINGQDDYVIALGNYYKERGVCGQRYLIVTSTGSYTAIVGDEKADCDTDSHKMVHNHGNGKYSLIEWIVDPSSLERSVKRGGSVIYSSNDTITGDILYIYRIY